MSDTTGHAKRPAKTILLVEDDPAVCYFLERVLHTAGYFVGMATNGVAALRLFRVRQWDLVITDRTMPGMNGEELASQIKQQAPNQPVVLITGILSRVERPELFDAIFSKPFAIAELLGCLSGLLLLRTEGTVTKRW